MDKNLSLGHSVFSEGIRVPTFLCAPAAVFAHKRSNQKIAAEIGRQTDRQREAKIACSSWLLWSFYKWKNVCSFEKEISNYMSGWSGHYAHLKKRTFGFQFRKLDEASVFIFKVLKTLFHKLEHGVEITNCFFFWISWLVKKKVMIINGTWRSTEKSIRTTQAASGLRMIQVRKWAALAMIIIEW